MAKIVRRRVGAQKPIRKVRTFKLGSGLPRPVDIRDELADMRAILLGHEEPPIDEGVMTLYEVAEGFYSRACDIEQEILRAMAEGRLPKTAAGNPYHQLRTQEIRSFKEMAKSAAELGSRRVTAADVRLRQETTGRESA